MNKYELKKLKVLFEAAQNMGNVSCSYNDIYAKVLTELNGDNITYYIESVMIDESLLIRKDKEGFVGYDSEGRRVVTFKPYYILTDKGLKSLKKLTLMYRMKDYVWVLKLIGWIATIIGGITGLLAIF